MKEKPSCDRFKVYLTERLGKGWQAPFVGSTWQAFEAWCHLCTTWYLADSREKLILLDSMAELLLMFQKSELAAVKAAIGAAGYEEEETKLWEKLHSNVL